MQCQALTVTTKQRVLLTGTVNIQDGLFQCHYHQCVLPAYLVDLHISTLFLYDPSTFLESTRYGPATKCLLQFFVMINSLHQGVFLRLQMHF